MPKKLLQEQVIERFNIIHNNKYDYSKVVYKNDNTKIDIICKVHGILCQRPSSHARLKQGCPRCSITLHSQRRRLTQKEFIESVYKIYGNLLDTTKSNYTGAHNYVDALCTKHNIMFSTQAVSLIRGNTNCTLCQKENYSAKIKYKYGAIFIQRAKKRHGDLYDYSKTIYTKSNAEIDIICKNHGMFKQVAGCHLAGNGCPQCRNSQGETLIRKYLTDKNISFLYQYKVNIEDSNHYFDFFIPEKNIIVEFNGLQHYKPIKWFGGEKTFTYTQKRDIIKEKYCLYNNIKLIKIHYKDKHKIPKILDNYW